MFNCNRHFNHKGTGLKQTNKLQKENLCKIEMLEIRLQYCFTVVDILS